MTDAALHTPATQRDGFSATALALAVFLHVLLVAGLWWISSIKPMVPAETAINVKLEDDGTTKLKEARPSPPPTEAARPSTPAPPPAPTPSPPRQQAAPVPPSVPAPAKPAPPTTPIPADEQTPPPVTREAARQFVPLNAPGTVLYGMGASGRASYLTQIARRSSQFRFYPGAALENREQGRVVVSLTIARDGRVVDARISQSSGSRSIDAAEIQTMIKSSPRRKFAMKA